MKLKLTLIAALMAVGLALHGANGTGTTNTLAKWLDGNTLGDSRVVDTGSVMSIGFEDGAAPNVGGIANSSRVIGIGDLALDSAVMDDVFDVFVSGVEAARGAQMRNQSGAIVGLGRLSLSDTQFDNTSQIVAIGASSLARAKLTNTSDIYAIGGGAGFEMTGVFDHVFLIGSGSTATGDNQWVAGDNRYHYYFPGTGADFAGPLTVLSATNQVTFGATASAPADPVLPAAWVSVQVAGDTNSYRIPLFK